MEIIDDSLASGGLVVKPVFKPEKLVKIIRSGNRTIVFWNDGTKTIVKRSEDEEDNIYVAFTAALAIKQFGSNSHLKKIIQERTVEQKKKEKKKDGYESKNAD